MQSDYFFRSLFRALKLPFFLISFTFFILNGTESPAGDETQTGLQPTASPEQHGYVFNHDYVLNLARGMSEKPMQPPAAAPEELSSLDYSTYRRINFQQNKAIWGDAQTKFSIQLFAPGFLYNDLIDIDIVESGKAYPLKVQPDSFTVPDPAIAEVLTRLGKYAGMRLHFPINRDEVKDEFIVFQGASYFRAVSQGQNYGISTRGLAVDVAQPMGEEFPLFKKFWIERPLSSQQSIVVHALLDSTSVTGAYRFGIYPGAPTRVDVQATLFPRRDIEHIGLAPLTSMFMFNNMDKADMPDYRPAVHDSEGLQILRGNGEMLWRPLNNPATLQVSAFGDENPKGFGLIQRQKRFDAYQDLEANYQTRPSVWVQPLGEWGRGKVELVEIPSDEETNDNIVVYWQPEGGVKKAQQVTYSYRLTWPNDTPALAGPVRIVRSAKGLKLFGSGSEVVIDYRDLTVADVGNLEMDASISTGRILETVIVANPDINGVRAYVAFDPEDAKATELRLQLKQDGEPVASTWLYRWLQ